MKKTKPEEPANDVEYSVLPVEINLYE